MAPPVPFLNATKFINFDKVCSGITTEKEIAVLEARLNENYQTKINRFSKKFSFEFIREFEDELNGNVNYLNKYFKKLYAISDFKAFRFTNTFLDKFNGCDLNKRNTSIITSLYAELFDMNTLLEYYTILERFTNEHYYDWDKFYEFRKQNYYAILQKSRSINTQFLYLLDIDTVNTKLTKHPELKQYIEALKEIVEMFIDLVYQPDYYAIKDNSYFNNV